jgi:hypothetical protein
VLLVAWAPENMNVVNTIAFRRLKIQIYEVNKYCLRRICKNKTRMIISLFTVPRGRLGGFLDGIREGVGGLL